MTFRYLRRYTGPLRAVILDWAGTTVDHGSLAPAQVFCAVFRASGVSISMAEARAPMGLGKRAHIEAIAAIPAVAARWRADHGRDITDEDIDILYERFLPLQVNDIEQYAEPIAGVVDTVAALRRRGLAIGATTGYTRAIMDVLEPAAAAAGYRPDVSVCTDDVRAGRPAPDMALRAMTELGVYPAEACVKVDDTEPGIEEGLNAGMWSVAVTATGNEAGLAEDEWLDLRPAEREAICAAAGARLSRSGAHYAISSVADILPCIEDIEARLRRGEKP